MISDKNICGHFSRVSIPATMQANCVSSAVHFTRMLRDLRERAMCHEATSSPAAP